MILLLIFNTDFQGLVRNFQLRPQVLSNHCRSVLVQLVRWWINLINNSQKSPFGFLLLFIVNVRSLGKIGVPKNVFVYRDWKMSKCKSLRRVKHIQLLKWLDCVRPTIYIRSIYTKQRSVYHAVLAVWISMRICKGDPFVSCGTSKIQ